MKAFALLLLFGLSALVSACVSSKTSTSASNSLPQPLPEGRWKFIGVDCVDHKLGRLAQATKKDLDSGVFEEFLVIGSDTVERHIRERKAPVRANSYCETVYSEKWEMHPPLIRVSANTFVSRQGVGGYKCYEPYYHNPGSQAYDLPYRLEGSKLILTHPDISVLQPDRTVTHECASGADLINIFEKQ